MEIREDIGERIKAMLEETMPDGEFHFCLVVARDAEPIQTIGNLCAEHTFEMLSQLVAAMEHKLIEEMGIEIEVINVPLKKDLN